MRIELTIKTLALGLSVTTDTRSDRSLRTWCREVGMCNLHRGLLLAAAKALRT